MDNKEALIKKIEDAIIIEEQAIPVYSNHMKVIFSWFKLSKEKKIHLNQIFDTLIKESTKHKLILEKVKEKIKTRKYDV